MGTNLGVLLPGDNRGSQSRFLSLGSSSVEQVSCALFGLFLPGEYVRGLFLLRGNGRTEFVGYPVKRIVERYTKHRAASANDSKRLVFTHPLRGIHCT